MGNSLLCRFEDQVAEIVIKSGNARFEGSTYHPLFGTQNDNHVLVVTLNDGCAEVEISW